MKNDMIAYYDKRASEYEKVYHIPAEQEDLNQAISIFHKVFKGKKVLEIACGTGYWTEQISKVATSIHATDIHNSMLQIAKERAELKNVEFECIDMYAITPTTPYTALFGGFIWSHIPIQELESFLQKLRGCLRSGAVVAFIDSKIVKGGSHDLKRLTRTDTHGNTFQMRTLANGQTYEVLKNFPTRESLLAYLAPITTHINHIELEHYWIVHFELH